MQDFLSKMTVAYMQHYGMTPSDNHLREWKQLYVNMGRI